MIIASKKIEDVKILITNKGLVELILPDGFNGRDLDLFVATYSEEYRQFRDEATEAYIKQVKEAKENKELNNKPNNI